MSSGSYGIIRPADFNPATDADVFLSFSQTRGSQPTGFTSVEASTYLTRQTIAGETNPIGGLYNLKLPLSVFNKVGIYTLYIRPKQTIATIQDVGVLSAYPDIRGLVLKASELTNINVENDNLTGYRIEYYNGDVKIDNLFRIVTSNNRCEPVNSNPTNSQSKSITYRFNDSSDLLFLTLSPSSAYESKPNSLPFIGVTGGKVILSNTNFNPIMIEIELTENDINTLYTSINGNQIRNLDNNLVTTYDSNNQIFSQTQYYTIKSNATSTPLYQVKNNIDNIDYTQDYNTITNS
jgi:hypothetical protein